MSTSMVVTGVVAALLAGGFMAWRCRSGTLSVRLLRAALPLCVFLAVESVAGRVVRPYYGVWEAGRLTPSVAWCMGIPVYCTETSGAVQTTMYPPGWVLAYTPVALGRTPTDVIRIGYALTPLMVFLPVAMACALMGASLMRGGIAAALCVFAATQMPALAHACFRPHAEAPALGFSLLACALLWGTRGSVESRLRLVAVAVLAWMAIWCKQTQAFLIPALGLWVWMAGGWTWARRFALYLVLAGVGLGAAFVSAFPWEGLWLNVVTIPARSPWNGQTPYNLVRAATHVLSLNWLPGALLLLGTAWQWERSASGAGSLKGRLLACPWILLSWVALWNVPMAVLGVVKVGGDVNNVAPVSIMLAAACGIMVAGVLGTPAERERAVPALLVFAIVALLVLPLWALETIQRSRAPVEDPASNSSERAFRYLREHSGEPAYFPTQPLAHLLAEGRLYHFSSAVKDRVYFARIGLSEEHWRRYIPERFSRVFWEPSWGEEIRSRYMPEFTPAADGTHAVAGFTGYVRKPLE